MICWLQSAAFPGQGKPPAPGDAVVGPIGQPSKVPKSMVRGSRARRGSSLELGGALEAGVPAASRPLTAIDGPLMGKHDPLETVPVAPSVTSASFPGKVLCPRRPTIPNRDICGTSAREEGAPFHLLLIPIPRRPLSPSLSPPPLHSQSIDSNSRQFVRSLTLVSHLSRACHQ